MQHIKGGLTLLSQQKKYFLNLTYGRTYRVFGIETTRFFVVVVRMCVAYQWIKFSKEKPLICHSDSISVGFEVVKGTKHYQTETFRIRFFSFWSNFGQSLRIVHDSKNKFTKTFPTSDMKKMISTQGTNWTELIHHVQEEIRT